MRSRMTSESSGGEHAADEIHQAGADQVAHALHVAHDARDQRAGFVGVVVGHRQAPDVLLHLAAQLGNQALALFGEQLGQGEAGDALHDGGGEYRAHQRVQQVRLVLVDDVVHQEFGRAGQHQAAEAANQHEQEAEREFSAPRPHQFLEQGQRAFEMAGGWFLDFAG